MKILISIFLVASLLFALLCLYGCNKLESGKVVEKIYEPSRVYVQLMPIVISNGKNTHTILVPYTIYDDEDYILKIQGEYKGELREECIYVTKEQFNKISEGQYINLKNIEFSMTDDNNKQQKNEQ